MRCLHRRRGLQVDQGHRTLLQADLGQLFVGRQFDDVEQRRADGHHVEVTVVGILGGRDFVGGHEARNYPRHRG